jgi:polar amino acid transport system substrate-binding protein
VLVLVAGVATAYAQGTVDPRVADLAQAGRIRVALFSTQYVKDPASGDLRGLRVDIARALAARVGVPPILLELRTPPEVVSCLKAGACDIAFLPYDARATDVADFTNPLIESQYTLLVPAASSITVFADADRPGIRIAAVRDHASTLTLLSKIRRAAIVFADNELAAFELLRSGQVDVFASTRQLLTRMSATLAGSRVLAGHYGANLNRIAVPKGHPGWLAFANAFVEDAKASGLVQAAIARDGGDVFQVAPPGQSD